MKKHNIFILVAILLILHSCDRPYRDIECYDTKPTEGIIFIKVTIDEATQSVPITFFEGKHEAGKVVLRDTLVMDTASYNVPVNTYYSITAEYKKDDKIIIAIQGGEVKTTKSSDEFDGTECWNIKNLTLNLRLK